MLFLKLVSFLFFLDLKTSSIPLSTKRLQKGQANFSRWAPKLLRRGVVEHHYTLPCDGPPKILHVTSFEKKRSNHAVLCCPGENWPVSKGMKKHRPWKWWDFLGMKHFESMKYMEESLNTRQNHYMKHSIVIFFSVFFLGDNAASQKSWGVPRFSHVASEGLISRDFSWLVGVGDFAETQEMFWVCFFSPGVIFSIATGKEHPPHVVFNIVYHEKKGNIFSCLISFVLGGSLHTFVFFSRCLTVNLHFWPQKFEFREGETLNLDRLLWMSWGSQLSLQSFGVGTSTKRCTPTFRCFAWGDFFRFWKVFLEIDRFWKSISTIWI